MLVRSASSVHFLPSSQRDGSWIGCSPSRASGNRNRPNNIENRFWTANEKPTACKNRIQFRRCVGATLPRGTARPMTFTALSLCLGQGRARKIGEGRARAVRSEPNARTRRASADLNNPNTETQREKAGNPECLFITEVLEPARLRGRPCALRA